MAPWDLLQGLGSSGPAKADIQPKSDLPGHHLMLAKIVFSVDKQDFEDYQYSSRRSELDEQVNNDEQYLLFCCIFRQHAPKYYPDMFMNICQNFLIADDQLRQEIEVLLSITRKMVGMWDANATAGKVALHHPDRASLPPLGEDDYRRGSDPFL